jgi:beta-lactam-binding protein with PASTA domain
MLHFFRAENKRDIFLHILIALLSGSILVVAFFKIYLPYTTNHGETITVPNLQGMHKDKLEEFLSERNLEIQIDDSTYNAGVQPFLVFQQYPLPGSKVKQNRKIYVSINSKNPPLVKMPNLKDRSFINAQRELESFGLLLGEINYVPDLQLNAVLKQSINGREIPEGELVAKGTKIDLMVGDGLSNRELDVPDLAGMPLDEALELLQGSNLQKGTVIYEEKAGTAPNSIIRQKPEPGSKIREGDMIDIWVSGKENENIEVID